MCVCAKSTHTQTHKTITLDNDKTDILKYSSAKKHERNQEKMCPLFFPSVPKNTLKFSCMIPASLSSLLLLLLCVGQGKPQQNVGVEKNEVSSLLKEKKKKDRENAEICDHKSNSLVMKKSIKYP